MGPWDYCSCYVAFGATYGPPPFQPCHVHWTAGNTERAHMVRQQHLLVRTTLSNFVLPSPHSFVLICKWSRVTFFWLYNAAYEEQVLLFQLYQSWLVELWNSFHRYGNTGNYRTRIDVTFAGDEWYALLPSLTSACTRLIASVDWTSTFNSSSRLIPYLVRPGIDSIQFDKS